MKRYLALLLALVALLGGCVVINAKADLAVTGVGAEASSATLPQ